MNQSRHPSYLALDRHTLGASTSEVQDHVANCKRCRAHLDRVCRPEPIPLWLSSSQRRRRPLHSLLRGWSFAFASLAVVVALFVLVPRRDHEGIREKGGPGLIVYLKRAETIGVYTGESIRAGDLLRLGVIPGSFRYVTVFSNTQGGLHELHSGKIPDHHEAPEGHEAPDNHQAAEGHETFEGSMFLLPVSFRVDHEGAREQLTIALSYERLSSEFDLQDAGEDVWIETIELSKEPSDANE